MDGPFYFPMIVDRGRGVTRAAAWTSLTTSKLQLQNSNA